MHYDVVILGGGLAGLTLALQTKNAMPKLRVLVLEKRQHPVPEATHKVGESCVEVSAHYFSNVLGLREHILEEQLPKLGLRFFFSRNGNRNIEERLELGGTRYPPAPSYQLDRGRFENYLAHLCVQRGIEFVDQTKVTGVELEKSLFGRRKPHRVSYKRKGESEKTVFSPWVLDASGRAGLLKRQLDLAEPSPHKANAAWFRVAGKLNVDDWSASPEWRRGHEGDLSRWYSTNHLMGRGYWVWLIPLASDSTSVGIVADSALHDLSSFNSWEKAKSWLEIHEPQCAQKLSKHPVQDFLALKHYSHQCKQVFSEHGWGLTGEAGYFLDPFYSPGSDFIAFGNTFLTDLVRRDLRGYSNVFHARYYDWLYRTCFMGTLHCYNGQYPLFGNPEVMSIKIMWDYMVYWTITAYLFFHDRMCAPMLQGRNSYKLMRIGKLNRAMQAHFRKWDRSKEILDIPGKINMSNIDLIYETNLSLLDNLSDSQFTSRFSKNVETMEQLFAEIVEYSGLECELAVTPKQKIDKKYLQHVYDVLSEEPLQEVVNA